MRYDPKQETISSSGRDRIASLVNWGNHGSHPTDVIGYTFDADTYCPIDAAIAHGLNDEGWVPEEAEDSEGNPVSPIFATDESDHPDSCAYCGAFLGNALTPDGYDYVLSRVTGYLTGEGGSRAVLADWWERYGDGYADSDLADALHGVIKATITEGAEG